MVSFFGFVQLAGVVDVVPNGVEAARYRYQRVPEGVAHPDSENGVFLAECLAGFDTAAVPASGTSSYSELEYAAEQGDKGYAGECEYAAAAVYDGTGAHQDGQCQGYAPEIETQVYLGCNPMVEARHDPTDCPGGKAGEYE